MRNKNIISMLVLIMIIFSFTATIVGIFSSDGPGPFQFTSIHDQEVLIYGKGLYKDMSAEVAPQGIAQDVVTLGLGIPMLLMSLYLTRKGSLKGRFMLAGTLGYFLVTYLFYLVMGMFNEMFLVYVILLSASFYAFILTLLSFKVDTLHTYFHKNLPTKFTGGFLIFNACAIAFLWLSIVLPPLLDGTIIPAAVEHYTTLIVQGLDLSILLPASFLSGVLLIKRDPFGYLLAPTYFVFLSLLMTALTAKIIAMSLAGANVFPVIIIIPLFNLTAIACATLILKSIDENKYHNLDTNKNIVC